MREAKRKQGGCETCMHVARDYTDELRTCRCFTHVPAPVSVEKGLLHEQRRPPDFRYSTFKANDDARLKLSIYVQNS